MTVVSRTTSPWSARGQVIALAVVVAWVAWLAGAQLLELARSPVGLAFGLALAGYLLRRSCLDAAVLALAVAAGHFVEVGLGPLFVAVASACTLAITRRPRFAAASGVGLLGLLWVAVLFKQRFAGAMLTWHDLKYFFLRFADNVGVMATQPTLLAYSVAVLAALAAAVWLFWRLDGPGIRTAGWRAQWAAALVAALSAGWGGILLRNEVQALGRESAWILGSLGEFKRPLSAFLATAGRQPHWLPPVADTTEFASQVRQRMAGSAPAARPADIVLFLQESQFNPASFEGCPPDLCELPVFQSSRQTVAHGPMQVHVYGGGTWLSEFALASGVPHLAFGPAGDFAPFTVAPGTRRSFARSLRDAGYRTVAVYPVRGGMMNARLAYAEYGFDQFLDSDDLGLSGSYGTTDEEVHAAARRVLTEERRQGRPVFLMVVTIFNHAEHGARMDRVPGALVDRASTRFPAGKVAENVADYVWRTHEFASAMKITRSAVLDTDRPAVLAWFGDHQPPFGNALSLRDRIRSIPTPAGAIPPQLQTWYHVSANVEHVPRDASLHALDLVFLPGLLAQTAGARIDEWLAANVAGREQCAGLLQGCARPGGGETYLSYLWKDLKVFDLR